jgi:hypothetical protein
MSWQIPTQIEQDIISGKAVYKTFQTGSGGQSILPVGPNSYVVIFGYDFSPAGGGFKALYEQNFSPSGGSSVLNDQKVRWFETQQISFYTGTDFFPFIHHCDIKTAISPLVVQNNVPPSANIITSYQVAEEIDNSPIARQVYITSTNDITITVGLILDSDVATQNAIPVTNRTPQALTYGGSGQVINTQTDFGPALTPQQFMQPSPKDYADFGFGLLPANADGQAFATPDTARGLYDPSAYLATLGVAFRDAAAANYFLCLHSAIYTHTVPETRG